MRSLPEQKGIFVGVVSFINDEVATARFRFYPVASHLVRCCPRRCQKRLSYCKSLVAAAPCAMVSAHRQDGKDVSVRFEIRDMTAGGEGIKLSATECKKAS